MRVVLLLVSSLHRILFRVAAVLLIALVLVLLDLIVTGWLGAWGVYGQLVFINLGLSLLLVVPIWHFISGYLISRYHHRKLDILVNLAIGVALAVMHNMAIIGTLSSADDAMLWLIFMGVSSLLIIGSWLAAEYLYRYFIHRYSRPFKHFMDNLPWA
jgi:hypothetical protein